MPPETTRVQGGTDQVGGAGRPPQTTRTRTRRTHAIGLHNLAVTVAWILAWSLSFGAPATVSAHPFGSRYFAHRVVLRLHSDRVGLEYLIEVPTSVVMREFYVALNGKTPSADEDARFTRDKIHALLDGLELRVDGQLLPWRNTTDPSLKNGVGDVNFFKYRITATAPLQVQPGKPHRLELFNFNYPAGEAYFSQELWASENVQVHDVSWWRVEKSGSVEDATGAWSRDGRLRDLSLSFVIEPGTGDLEARVEPPSITSSTHVPATPTAARKYYVPQVEGVPLLPYLRQAELSPGIILLSLGLALFFGAAHALSPGHGKTLVAAYLVGSRGTVRDAVVLGITVTVAHTAGVILLGAVTLYASDYVVPEKLFPVVEMISGLLIVTIGAWMIRSRWKARRAGGSVTGANGRSEQGGHTHAHDGPAHGHTHAHEGPAHGHAHAHEGHVHKHEHGVAEHSHWPGHVHSHEVPEGEVTVGSLLRLGIAGGMVPCPTAMVVLLAAIALHRIALGLAMVVAFSVGLAAVLVVIGVVMVLAGSALDRFSWTGRWVGYLPVVSAVLVTMLGMIVLGKAVIGMFFSGTPG